MKKIIIFAKSLGGGGTEVALISLLNALDYSQYKVKLVLLDDDDEYRYRLKNNVEIEKIKFKTRIAKKMVSMHSFLAKVLKKLSVNHYIHYYDWLFNQVENKFEQVDIALDFYGYGYFLTGYIAKKIKAKKKATWLHDEKFYWLKSVDRYIKYYDCVFGVSKAVALRFSEQYPEFSDKSKVFYNVIDTNEIQKKSNEKIKLEFDGNFNILTVGRLTEQKGYDIAVKTAEELKNKRLDFKWYVIGDGRDEKSLKTMVSKAGLNECFIFLGRKDNPYPYMKACDLYVQPSRHEGYGLTVLEAKLLNKVIIASDLAAFREQIIDSYNGFIVDLQPEAIADKIWAVINDKQLYDSVKLNLSDEKFDFMKEMRKIEEM